MRGLLLAFCLIAAAITAPARAAEQINLFDSTVDVGTDDSLSVTETIVVQVEGVDFKRGLLRLIPIAASQAGTDDGFQVTSVTRDGQSEPFEVSVHQGTATIRIGSADVLLPHGEHRYVIAYRFARQVQTNGQFSQLAWNINGHDWAYPMERVTATVRLPPGARARRFQVVTGGLGGQGKDATAKQAQPGILTFESKRAFEAREGMSVFIDWVKPVSPDAPK